MTDRINPYLGHQALLEFFYSASEQSSMSFYIPLMFKDIYEKRMKTHLAKHYPNKFQVTTFDGVAGRMIKFEYIGKDK